MRARKEIKYVIEREELMIKILKMIGITKERKRIKRDEIDNEDIKEKVNKMMEDIKKYYTISKWRSIKTWKDKEINIILNILKTNGIETIKVDRKRKEEDKYKHYREYIFEIKEELINKL